MSRRKPLPGEQDVRDALAQMRAEAAEGGVAVSVLGLARRLGISNATFWRNFREIATEIRQAPAPATRPAAKGPSARDPGLEDQNSRLRRERDQIAGQLEAALGHLRRLTTDNARLHGELEAARGISRLDTARAARKED
jgi:transposase-like protein